VLSAVQPETIANRLNSKDADQEGTKDLEEIDEQVEVDS